MNDTFYTAASSYSSWDITFNLPPFNLTNAAFIFNPVNYTYHVLGGLDRETRQANEKHWVQNATSIENTDPWVTWPEPPSTLGADAKVKQSDNFPCHFLTLWWRIIADVFDSSIININSSGIL